MRKALSYKTIFIAFAFLILPDVVLSAINPDSLLSVIKTSKNDTVKIKAELALADWLIQTHQNDSAQALIGVIINNCDNIIVNKNIQLHVKETVSRQKVQALNCKGSLCRKRGRSELALEILNSSIDLASKINYKDGLAFAYMHKGEALDYMGNLNHANEFFFKALELFREVDNKYGIAKTLNAIGTVYDYQGELDTALDYYTQSLKVYESFNFESGIADQYNNIGIIYYLQGDYETALEYYLKSLRTHEKAGSVSHSYSMTLNNIGLIYENLGNALKAIDYYEKSLKVFELIDIGTGIVLPLNNLGEAYRKQGDYEKALEYFNKSLGISDESNDVQGEAYTLDKICSIYIILNDFLKASFYCKTCLEKYIEIGDKHGIAISYIGLGTLNKKTGKLNNALDNFLRSVSLYKEIGDKQGMATSSTWTGSIYFEMGKYSEAYKYAKEGYRLAKELGYPADIQSSAKLLNQIYQKFGNFEKALKYYEEYIAMKDSLVNIDIKNRIQDQYYKYQYEKKALTDSIAFAQTLAIKKIELDKQKEESKRQMWILYLTLLGLIVVVAFSITILKLFLDKRKANDRLELSYAEINQKNEEIVAQRDQIKIQHEYVLDQKTLLEKSHRRITDSINYAKLIQTALLPSDKMLAKIMPENTVYYKPCDIVSGDFYWVKEIQDIIYIVVADCTGHGVPGAFMSMLGIAFLNEITRREDIKSTSDILNILRQEVVNSLSQDSLDERPTEGMNVSVLAINKSNMRAQFSGAYGNMCVIRNADNRLVGVGDEFLNITEKDGQALNEIRGNPWSVGKSSTNTSFTSHVFNIFDDDMLYIYTDGFIDQLNGISNRRFNSQRFKSLLLDINKLDFQSQHRKLESTYSNWKGENEQTDDILIVGLRPVFV
ncbi:MAG: tetratricopeptide repeat protein [Bacteroidetes bacterium]|nr:tetratricopeptide repeat protein [Bacteroidota bacterium]